MSEINLVKVVKKVEKDGVVKHYSNYYLNCGDLSVQVKPSFIDSSNFKLLDAICEITKKGVDVDGRN